MGSIPIGVIYGLFIPPLILETQHLAGFFRVGRQCTATQMSPPRQRLACGKLAGWQIGASPVDRRQFAISQLN